MTQHIFKASKIATIEELLFTAKDLTGQKSVFIELSETTEDIVDGNNLVTGKARGLEVITEEKRPFTNEEQYIMDLLVKAHNRFALQEQTHPDDMREWVDGLHEMQSVLMQRVVRRDYPDFFSSTP